MRNVRELSPAELEAISGSAVKCSTKMVCGHDGCRCEASCELTFQRVLLLMQARPVARELVRMLRHGVRMSLD